MTITRPFLRTIFVGALVASCAAGPRSRPESVQRVPDSAPDKIAAQRAATGLHLEEDDERWGIVAARQRKDGAARKDDHPPIPPEPHRAPLISICPPTPAFAEAAQSLASSSASSRCARRFERRRFCAA